MIAILLLYFIWKMYAHLAELYNKKKWVLAIIGIAVYFGAQVLVGLIIGLIQINDPTFLSGVSDLVLNLIGIPVGILASYALYKYLKIRWAKTIHTTDGDIIDADILEEN